MGLHPYGALFGGIPLAVWRKPVANAVPQLCQFAGAHAEPSGAIAVRFPGGMVEGTAIGLNRLVPLLCSTAIGQSVSALPDAFDLSARERYAAPLRFCPRIGRVRSRLPVAAKI